MDFFSGRLNFKTGWSSILESFLSTPAAAVLRCWWWWAVVGGITVQVLLLLLLLRLLRLLRLLLLLLLPLLRLLVPLLLLRLPPRRGDFHRNLLGGFSLLSMTDPGPIAVHIFRLDVPSHAFQTLNVKL